MHSWNSSSLSRQLSNKQNTHPPPTYSHSYSLAILSAVYDQKNFPTKTPCLIPIAQVKVLKFQIQFTFLLHEFFLKKNMPNLSNTNELTIASIEQGIVRGRPCQFGNVPGPSMHIWSC